MWLFGSASARRCQGTAHQPDGLFRGSTTNLQLTLTPEAYSAAVAFTVRSVSLSLSSFRRAAMCDLFW